MFIYEPGLGGALFLTASDGFKRVFMELTKEVLQGDECRKATAAMTVGKNSIFGHASEWIFNPRVHIDSHGDLVSVDQSYFGSKDLATHLLTVNWSALSRHPLTMAKHSIQCVQQLRHSCLRTPHRFWQPWPPV